MLLSSYTVFSLTYTLPTELGVNAEFYFLELVPIILMFTLCVVFTSRVLAYFEKRNQGGAQGEDDGRHVEDAKSSFLYQIFDQLNTIVLLLMMLGCKLFEIGRTLPCHHTVRLLPHPTLFALLCLR